MIPPGLVAGEALTNALRHAFPEGRAGRVRDGAGSDQRLEEVQLDFDRA